MVKIVARAWYEAPLKKLAYIAALVGLAIVMSLGSWLTHRWREDRQALQAEVDRVAILPAPAAEGALNRDFSAQTPEEQSARAAVQAWHDSTSAAGGILRTVRVEEHAPTASTLGKVELDLQWQGSYAQLKELLAEMVTRTPGSTLHRLAVRRSAAPATEVEAHLGVHLWFRPLPTNQARPATMPAGK